MLEEYGLSRESLREGLRLLEVQGLITIRRGPGGGPIVGHLDPASLGRTSTLYYHLAGATYRGAARGVGRPRADPRRAGGPQPRPGARAGGDGAVHSPSRDEHDDEALEAFVAAHSASTTTWRRSPRTGCSRSHLQTVGQIVTHHILGHADPRQDRETIEGDHVAIAKAIAAGAPPAGGQGDGGAHRSG